jgi:hypothetical protein
MVQEIYCETHPLTKLICPRCIAGKGGSNTAKKYGHEQLAKWGRRGGRPKKKKSRKRLARAR